MRTFYHRVMRCVMEPDMKRLWGVWCYSVVCLLLFTACHYPRPDLQKEGMSDQVKDSLTYLAERHYTYNTNFEVQADSVVLERLPVKDSFISLYRGDRVVVAEFAIHPADSVDSVWVKLAHSQEAQGWIREKDLIHSFVPTDSISQFIFIYSAIRMLRILSLSLPCLWVLICFGLSVVSSCKWSILMTSIVFIRCFFVC